MFQTILHMKSYKFEIQYSTFKWKLLNCAFIQFWYFFCRNCALHNFPSILITLESQEKNIASTCLVGWRLRTRNKGHSTPLLNNFTCKITAILVTNNLYHPHAGLQQNNSNQMYLFKIYSSPSGWKASSVVRLTSSPIVKYPWLNQSAISELENGPVQEWQLC